MITSGLHNRAPTITDRGPGRRPQPGRDPSPSRHLLHPFGERPTWTVHLITDPATFPPPQRNHPARDRQITGRSRDPLLHTHRLHPTPRTHSRTHFGGCQIHDRPAVVPILDPRDRQAIQAQQPGRIVDHARGCSVVILRRQQE
jgi:hypothetical protein